MTSAMVKYASREPGRTQLREEAALLRRARHPGVVEIAGFEDDEDGTRLTLTSVDGSTLAESPPTDPTAGLRLLAALARTVADLHRLGIAHRNLRADHVLVARDGRPVLCGFAGASDNADPDDRVADESALVDLVDLVAASCGAGARASRPAAALRTLASSLRSPDADRGAAAIAARAGRLAARHASGVPSPPRRTRGRTPRAASHRRVVEIVAVAAGVLVLVIALASRSGDDRTFNTTATAGETSTAKVVSATTTTSGAPTAPGAEPTARPVRFEAGGATFDVGITGDEVVVADWACTGAPSAVLLRPSTGEVFFFATLPDAGEPRVGQRLSTIAGAVGLAGTPNTQRCPRIQVRDARGAIHTVVAS